MKTPINPVAFDVLKAESFVRGENTLAVIREMPFDDVAAHLEKGAQINDIGPVIWRELPHFFPNRDGVAVGRFGQIEFPEIRVQQSELISATGQLAAIWPALRMSGQVSVNGSHLSCCVVTKCQSTVVSVSGVVCVVCSRWF